MSKAPEAIWANQNGDVISIRNGYPDLNTLIATGRLTKYVRADRIEKLEHEVKTLRKGIEIYERERNRYKHAFPEKTGAYFLAGGYGDEDDNHLPQFVEIVPAYGCGWSQVYEKTCKTISYEGS